jgi:hypothetical protein
MKQKKSQSNPPSSIISGNVVDPESRPVGNVKISLGGKAVGKSREDGAFTIELAKPESRVVVTFAAEGYVSNTRVFDSKATGINTVVIWPVAYRVKFDPARELDIELGASRIRVPANALAGAGGKKAGGQVDLAFTLFDITSPWQRAAAPGDFTGKWEDGSVRRLDSYGIFDLAVRDQKGGRLNLRPDTAIDLSIGLPRRLFKRPPRRVGYFTFDILAGLWIHAGAFVFAPRTLTYNGTITNLGGAHNLDNPQLTTCVTVQVTNVYDGSGLPGMLVMVQGAQYTFSATTNANGFVCLIVDRNASFSFTAQGSPYGSGSFWATPQPVTLTSPNIQSDATNCGDPVLCPFIGTVPADFVTGMRVAAR